MGAGAGKGGGGTPQQGQSGKGGAGQSYQQAMPQWANQAGLNAMSNAPGSVQGLAALQGAGAKPPPPQAQYRDQMMAARAGMPGGFDPAANYQTRMQQFQAQNPQMTQADQDAARTGINSLFGLNTDTSGMTPALTAPTGTSALPTSQPAQGGMFSTMSPEARQNMANQMYNNMAGGPTPAGAGTPGWGRPQFPGRGLAGMMGGPGGQMNGAAGYRNPGMGKGGKGGGGMAQAPFMRAEGGLIPGYADGGRIAWTPGGGTAFNPIQTGGTITAPAAYTPPAQNVAAPYTPPATAASNTTDLNKYRREMNLYNSSQQGGIMGPLLGMIDEAQGKHNWWFNPTMYRQQQNFGGSGGGQGRR